MRERALGGASDADRAARPPTSGRASTSTHDQGRRPTIAPRRKRFIAPDDGNPDDQTVMAVPLPQPIAPGATATIEVEWTAHVPRTFARTGAIGNFFFIAQWFPKLGVLQEDGWNCHQFHASTEFFSDFGVYDVSLTVPGGWPLGATGVEGERCENTDGTTTYRYYQEDVHDFAWTTSPDYIERTARFEHPRLPAGRDAAAAAAGARRAGRTALRRDADDAEVLRRVVRRLPVRPHHHRRSRLPERRRRDGVPDAVHRRHALARAGAGDHAGRASRSTKPATSSGTASSRNNEFEDAWMDEGLNTFSTARAIAQVYDPNYLALRYFGGFIPWVFHDIALSRETEGNRLAGLPARREERRAVHAVLPLLPGDRRQHHLQQDGAVAEHDGTLARLADDAAHHVHLLRAVAVQASEAGRLLRGGERGRRPRSRLVLRPGVSQLERLRLRRAGPEERARGRPVPHDADRPPLRRGDLPGGCRA